MILIQKHKNTRVFKMGRWKVDITPSWLHVHRKYYFVLLGKYIAVPLFLLFGFSPGSAPVSPLCMLCRHFFNAPFRLRLLFFRHRLCHQKIELILLLTGHKGTSLNMTARRCHWTLLHIHHIIQQVKTKGWVTGIFVKVGLSKGGCLHL